MSKRAYQNCSVFGCLNTTLNRGELTYFKLPNSEIRRIEWLKLIQREDLLGKPSTHCRVCETHFDAESILTSPNRKVLKQNTLPRLLLPDRKYKSIGCQATVKTVETTTFCNFYLLETPNNTPRKRKLDNIINECTKRLKITTAEAESSSTFLKLCDTFLHKNLADIVKQQTKNKCQRLGNRYSEDYKFFCLNLFYISPLAYGLLKDTLGLPSKSTLNSMYYPITTKVNNHFIKLLKTKVEHMTDMEKNCSLVIGEINLKTNLYYNIREDRIYGFHEIDGVQSKEPAKHALVAMIKGIFENYKQPVGYALLAENKKYDNVSKWIDKLIKMLHDIGLNVRVFISDMDSDFLNSTKKRLISAESPFFLVDKRKIFHIYDPPYLMKLVRNSLIDNDFHFDNFVAKWDDILQFYDKEKIKQIKIAAKLTDSHLSPNNEEKMKVKFALQVFSTTVAAGLATYRDFGAIDPTAEGTIQLIKTMNDIFDFLNSTSRLNCTQYQNPFCGEEYQIAFINETLNFFTSLILINRQNGEETTNTIKFIEGFKITLKSIMLLFEDLKSEGYNQIFTRRLNQDCLESFFGQVKIRNSKATEPTSWQLVSALRNYFFTGIESPKEGECSDELAIFLLDDKKISKKPANQTKREQVDTVASEDKCEENMKQPSMQLITTTDYSTLDLPEHNTLVYICGYLLEKCLSQHKDCDFLKSYVTLIKSEDAKQQSEGEEKRLLIIPHENFVKFVEEMEDQFGKFLREKFINCRILKGLLAIVEDLSFAMPCECFPLLYCKKLFMKMRLYHTLKHNNSAFRTCRDRQKYFSVFSLTN